jgi:hypothetical protein
VDKERRVFAFKNKKAFKTLQGKEIDNIMNMQPHQSLITKQGLNGSSDQLGSIVKTSLETCSERQDYALEERKQEQLGNASLEAAVSRFRTKPSSDSLQMNLDMDISASSERATPGRRRSSRRWSRYVFLSLETVPKIV